MIIKEKVDTMTRRVFGIAAVSALGSLCVSCGGTAPGLSSVSGKVICNGQPATGAVLNFHRQAGQPAPPPEASKIIPTAIVGEDGSFTVESQPLGYGAAPGKYNILVQWSEELDPAQVRSGDKAKVSSIKGKKVVLSRHDKLKSTAPDRLRGRYSDSTKPLLHAEVTPGTCDLGTLELELKK